MPITGLSFLLFALAAVVLYYLFPKRLRQYVLLAASILFYLTYGVRMAGYLAATILLTYLFGLWLACGLPARCRDQGGAQAPEARK